MTRIRAKSNTDAARTPFVLDQTVAHNGVDVLDKIVCDQVVRPTQMSDANRISVGRVWRSIALGLVVGLVISGLSGLFTGAGHGWGSGVISSSSIVGAPLAGVAWAMRGRALGRTFAVFALLVGVVTDGWLWTATVGEGASYLGKVFSAMPLLLLLWLVLFIGWQIVAATAAQTPTSTKSP